MPTGKFWAKESVTPPPTAEPRGRLSFIPPPPSFLCRNVPGMLDCCVSRLRAFDGKVETALR